MQVFITGTDTDIGKTIICSWLCLHTRHEYFKPIQTGASEGTDTVTVTRLAGVTTYPETYLYQAPLSPHLASALENEEIILERIRLPSSKNLIIEGAGGLLVPINKHYMMIDLIKYLDLPVILIASTRLGTINHTLLSLEALRARNIEILGVIMNGSINSDACHTIESYGKIPVLAQVPMINPLCQDNLRQFPLSKHLQTTFEVCNDLIT